MQLGTRWTSGDEPPRAVPEILREQIAAVDTAVDQDPLGQPRPRWTLTWLEGRPVAELENGVVVRVDREGEVVVGHIDDDGMS
ncbi:hypothetical protein KZX37_13060 [Microbacterium sp. EYE_5]|uniref:hypothetical protein n=1 Tax=unclassified Microbacterium TaxID=2609290 RepID=UPI002002E5AA|nr:MULTISPECIES: hypothetical protein [unclassified Microbacterium]MCK6080563.1 hypothetical protein [Microbacterium sp. EYE_382]MCK6085834.1 hypothetical protein [Microbacterium sp. EYE_384]MCK6124668.1 hypothetical protein [Microbacterium sp. EYE_80]MCK6127577.1 hypothetical protein [Microbacterium sp. EYE_79]MCK6141518.1 hypothetical protein [Microbacterium sp. EYE_39]